MPRAIDGRKRKNNRKKIMKSAKGFVGRRGTNYRVAKDSVRKAGQYAYRDRKRKKGDFRKLWIARINAACRAEDITYSRFMNGLLKAGVTLDRKALSNLAILDNAAFVELVNIAKKAL
ncbi:MAG: 50S ribosomal protein L20 [Spirochaetales bacterium]|nr:50S ribosomal protein L20 [Spirochaetales bacterium]